MDQLVDAVRKLNRVMNLMVGRFGRSAENPVSLDDESSLKCAFEGELERCLMKKENWSVRGEENVRWMICCASDVLYQNLKRKAREIKKTRYD